MINRIVVAFIGCVIISGCASINKVAENTEPPDYYQGEAVLATSKSYFIDNNIHAIEAKKYYKNIENPIGLALSGGGVRSATFNIGLLAGLDKGSSLQNIDILSTVSGGSYAAYWYYSKLYIQELERKKSIKDRTFDISNDSPSDIFEVCYPFAIYNKVTSQYTDLKNDHDWGPHNEKKDSVVCGVPKYRFQNHLKNNSILLRRPAAFSTQNLYWNHYLKLFSGALPSGAISKVGEVVGSHNNVNLARDYYQNGVERTYGLYPAPSNDRGVMSGQFLNTDPVKDRITTFGLEKEAYRSRPILLTDLDKIVFNKTESECKTKNNSSDKKSCYKPPFWVNNLTAGIKHNFKLFRLFSDGFESEPFDKVIYEVTPMSTGSGQHQYTMNIDINQKLTCKYIGIDESCLRTVSDYVSLSGAAIDISPYHEDWLKFGVALGTATGIGQLGDYNIDPKSFYKGSVDPFVYLTDGGHSDNLGIFSLLRRGIKTILISDAEHDEDGKVSGLKRVKRQLADNYHLDIVMEDVEFDKCLNETNAICIRTLPKYKLSPEEYWQEKPVFKGEIRDQDTGDPISKIIYVKLRAPDVFNRESAPKYHPLIRYIGKVEDEHFPQISTLDIDFSATQYHAYFALGKFYGEQLALALNENK